MDSYLFIIVLTLLQSISLICCSGYSFPKYVFELPDKMHATSLSLLSLTSYFPLLHSFLCKFFLQPLLGLVNSESTFFSKLVN